MESTRQFKRRGLTEVHHPAIGTPLVDVVFVHGLDGDPRSTWTSEKDKVFWPSQLLPPILQEEKARILVYGYDANVTRSRNGPATMSRDKIHNHGEQLVAELCGNRSKPEAAKRPIIFVAHSLGGLVVKYALIHSSEIRGTKTRRLRSIFVSTYGIVFLGTPHKGFDIREWISQKELASGARVLDKRIRIQSHIIDALQSNSETLQVLDRRFIDLTEKFHIFLFHEGKPTRMNGKLYYVVQEESAAPTIQDVEHAVIQQDHAHMCQFENDNSPGFALVTEAVQRYASAAPENIQAAWGLEDKEHHVRTEAEVREKLSSISISDYPRTLDTGSSKATDSQHKRHYIVPRTQVKNFIGREAQLGQISSHFSNDRADKQPQILILHALGGQGKSQLVLKYCSSSREIYEGIFWVNASSEQLAMQSYAQVGKALGIASSAMMEKNYQMINIVREHLEGWSQPWLLVFDNYDEPQKFSKIQQFIPQFKQGRVIFTSRNGQLGRLGHRLMEIPAMNAKEGVSLLLRGHSDEDIEQYFIQASCIVERLGGLPLAIDQAAAYIHSRRLHLQQLDKFLIIYEAKRKDILLHTPAYFWEYTTSQTQGEEGKARAINAFTTWEMSLEQLRSDSTVNVENMVHLLTLSAFFNPTKIEEFLFRNHWKKNRQMASWLRNINTVEEKTNQESEEETSDHHSFNQELDILWDSERYLDSLSNFYELSLLQSLETDADEISFSLHPLIRDWLQLRESTRKRQNYIEESIEVMVASVKVKKDKVRSLEYNSALSVHVDACLANDEQFSRKQHKLGIRIESCESAGWLATFYHNQGRYQEAEKLYRDIVATQENELGIEHKDTLRNSSWLAGTLREQGKFDEAEELFHQIVQLRQKVLGKDHADTIESLDNVAFLYYGRGKFNDAENMYGHVLQWRITELGQDNPETLSTMRAVGWVLTEQGRYEEAEKMQRQTLHLTEQTLGSEHNDYVTSTVSLASTLNSQQKYEEAEQLQRQGLYLHEKRLGKKHPRTLTALNDLASTLVGRGKTEEAEQMYRETLKLSQEVRGKTHPETVTIMHNLAFSLHSQGGDEAEKFNRETLELKKQVLGMEHPSTLNSMNNLALTLPNHEAEPLYRETLRLRQEVLGSNHPDTLNTMHNLASRLPDPEAEPLFRETLRLRREVLGSNHSDTLNTMNSLASKLSNGEAEPMFRETLRLRIEVLGEKHSDTLNTMNWLAYVLRKQGKNDEAEAVMKDLAAWYWEQGKNDKAEKIEQQLLELRQHDDGHSDCLNDAGEDS